MAKTIYRGGLLLDPTSGTESRKHLVVDGQTVTALLPADGDPSSAADCTVVDLKGQWLCPGLVDLSCALREPGYEQNETIATGLAAAAKGGITSVCASPETFPVVDNAAVVMQVKERAAGVVGARLVPIGAATKRLEGDALASYGELKSNGCPAVTQGTSAVASANMMRRVLEYAKAFDIIVFHQAIEPTMTGICHEGPWSTRLGLPATPAQAESIAIERDVALAALTDARLHLTRVSTALGIDAIRRAKARGVRVTCDVTINHLHLEVSSLVNYDSNYKVWPPLRSERDVEALREGLADGTVDAITSDHRPVHVQDKALEFMEAEPGISSLETLLPLTLSLADSGIISRLRAIDLLSAGPRRVLGFDVNDLSPGSIADITIIDPTMKWMLNAATMISKGKNSPFLGREFTGGASRTIVAGTTVYEARSEG